MDQHAESSAMEPLAALIGEWSMEARFKDIPPADASARAVFEWMPGQRFLIERWQVPVPEAPDWHRRHRPRSRKRGQLPPALLRLARRCSRLQDELERRDLEAVEGLARFLAAELLATLHGHLQRRRQNHLRGVGNQPRRRHLGARLRSHLHEGQLVASRVLATRCRARNRRVVIVPSRVPSSRAASRYSTSPAGPTRRPAPVSTAPTGATYRGSPRSRTPTTRTTSST